MSKPKKPAYQLVIEKNNIDPTKLSKTIKGYLNDYKSVLSGVEALESLKAENDGKGFGEDEERELSEFITNLEEKDKDLVERINTWLANADANKERASRMTEGREKAKQEKENVAKGLNPDGSVPTGNPLVDPPVVITEPPVIPKLDTHAPPPPPPAPEDPKPTGQTKPAATPPAPANPPEKIEITPAEEVEEKKNNNVVIAIVTFIGIGLLAALGIRSMKK